MQTLDLLLHGLSVACTPINLLFALIGCLLGTLIGVLPGIGPLATISMLLSLTIRLEPVTSLIMLAGVFYGAQYGGSTTAILCKIPGEASSVVTTIDGYTMAQRGRGGVALAAAAFSSLLAGVIATVFIAFFSPVLAEFAVSFNAPEYFALMLFGLLSAVFFSAGSKLKAMAMGILGLLFGLVGTDVETGALRFTLGISEFSDGLDLVAVSMAFFGLNEIIMNIGQGGSAKVTTAAVGSKRLSLNDAKRGFPAALRGTFIGSILGVLPGGGVQLSPFASYLVEQRVSKHRAELGQGAIEGVAAPEAANNAAAQTSFIPLLTLGIPGNPVIALILGAMIMQGIQPGPLVLVKQPELVWGLIASMLVGNVMLVIINLPLIGLWVRLLSIRQTILFPIIIVFACIAVYTVSNSVTTLAMMSLLAVLGIVLTVLRFPLIPLLLGLVLGPMMEESLRRALNISRGDPLVFLTRPISLTILLLTVATLAIVFLPSVRKNEAIFAD